MTKKLIRFSTAVMTTLLALVVLWQFRMVAVYVLVSVALAAALRPLVNRLVGRRLVVRGAWILLYVVVLGGFGLLLFLAGRGVIGEIQDLARTVAVQDAWKLPTWLKGSAFQGVLAAWLPPPSRLFEAITGDQGQLVLPAIFGFTQGITGVVSRVLIVLLLSIYWIVNQVHYERLWLSLLPPGQRRQVRSIWRTIEPNLGAYIRSQAVQSLLAGLVLGLGYWALGSPYPILLALVGALAGLIPMVGAPLAVVSPLLVGLLTSVQLSLVTVLYTLVALVALGIWVWPRLFNRRWDNPILTIVLLIALESAFGLLGILIAPPISAVCQILWDLLVSHRRASGAAAQVSDLKERQEQVGAIIRAMDEAPPALVTSSMKRLTELIAEAEPVLHAVEPLQVTKAIITAESGSFLPLKP